MGIISSIKESRNSTSNLKNPKKWLFFQATLNGENIIWDTFHEAMYALCIAAQVTRLSTITMCFCVTPTKLAPELAAAFRVVLVLSA